MFIQACTNSNNNSDDQGPALFPQPKTFPVNTDGGYITNTLTGDTIQPIINSLGDTIKTGIAIPAIGKYIHPDSVLQPKSFPAGQGKVVPAHPNVHIIPDNLTVIPVDESKLKKINITDGENHFIINSAGDTVKTGVPIPAIGKTVPCKFPKSTPALPLRMKDNAFCDIQYLDVDQGMGSSRVNCMLEDKSENLWFGTENGVLKYNGKSFVNFTESNGLSNNAVNSILEDRSGNLWFGTWRGVSKYDGKSFVHFTENEGLSNNVVVSIFEDLSGNIWFGTWGGGVSKYDGKSFVHFTQNEGLSNVVFSIAEDKFGNLWFGSGGEGVSKYDGKCFVHFTKNEGLTNNVVRSILEDKSGNIWFGTNVGATKYDGKSLVSFTENEGLSNNAVYSILEDKFGNIWFGTWGEGVSKYNGNCVDDIINGTNFYQHNQLGLKKSKKDLVKSFVQFSENEGLSDKLVWSILEDKSGNLWFGTNGGGVSKFDDKSFVHFSENEGLSNNVVWSINEDQSGNIWFGTLGGGVSKYDGKCFVHFSRNEGLSNNLVISNLEDKFGNLWFGTYDGGVSKYDGKTFAHFSKNEGLSDNAVISILEDKSGNLWFGTNGGVSKYDGKSFVHFTEKEGLSNKLVWSIIEDKSGNLWFGTNGGGVSKYDGKSFVHFTEKEGLSNNVVLSISEDQSGNLWFGTRSGGVSKFDGKSFVHFTENEGLSSNAVHSILKFKSDSSKEGEEQDIWLSTAKGLTRITRNDDKPGYDELNNNSATLSKEKKEKIRLSELLFSLQILKKEDGLKGLDFNPNSVLLDSKNRIWWGTGKGVEMLDLNKFETNIKVPFARLTNLEINETFIDYRNISDSLKEGLSFIEVASFENYPLNLKLPYNKNHLTFYFSAIDWAAPDKIKFQYILEGLDENWSAPSNETKVDYRNIPYGTFTFKVRAIGESQIWGAPFEYTFTILPPWWHTWWFRGLMAFVFVLALYLLYRSRTAALRARQKQLEKTVEERTAEVIREKNEVHKQKELVEEKHKEITDSINYAERIQRSFLATKDLLDENLKEYFVLFQPKDVVSGDFYWATKLQNNQFALVTADSTGHGVPGAIMSILNITCLEKAVQEEKLIEPGEILNHARLNIIDRLKKDGSPEGGKDGMDASLVCFDLQNKKLNYAAANNPVWIVRQNEILEFAPDKMPVGKHDKQHVPFTSNEVDLKSGDVVYTLTDGMPDQFGGEKGKKFMYKKLKELLISIANDSMENQKEKLSKAFFDWKGDLEQVDDVCVIGVRV